MGNNTANIHQLRESVFAVIGVDGATNFGLIKGEDNSAVLIDGASGEWMRSMTL